jgi:acetyl esterase
VTRPVMRAEVAALLLTMAALDRPPLDGLSFEELQATIQQTLATNADPCRDDLHRIEDLRIPRSDGTGLPARLYSAHASSETRPVVLFFHGGGFMTGNLDTHQALAADIAAHLEWTVVAVDYRLAPQHPFPAAVDDAMSALEWLDAGPGLLGHPLSGIVLAGDSAGGTLAAVCAGEAGRTVHPLLCHWLMYATLDLGAKGGSMDEFAEGHFLTRSMMQTFRQAYLPAGIDWSDPRVSPLHADSLVQRPPAMIFTCEFDPLRDQARRYAERLVAAGVAVRYREGAGLVHGAFTTRRVVPSASSDLLQCADDVRSLVTEGLATRALHLEGPGSA